MEKRVRKNDSAISGKNDTNARIVAGWRVERWHEVWLDSWRRNRTHHRWETVMRERDKEGNEWWGILKEEEEEEEEWDEENERKGFHEKDTDPEIAADLCADDDTLADD